jgi:DNA-binding CsgD family transcriptional regulator
MRTVELTERDRRLLELLGKGLSNQEIARRLGYRHGSIRVYLHNLYKKLGVEGKTAAAVWFMESAANAATTVPAGDESVGDMALRTNLLTTLGAMSLLIGPYGKLWHVASRLKAQAPDPSNYENRQRCRPLWEALLRGDFAYGSKTLEARGRGTAPFRSPMEGLLLALLLRLAGTPRAANRVTALLDEGKHLGADAAEFLAGVREAVEEKAPSAGERLHRNADRFDAFTPLRHMAVAVLFHVHKAFGEIAKARVAAQTLWAEAEASRQHLKAMGEPALDAAPPDRTTEVPKDPRRRKAAAS